MCAQEYAGIHCNVRDWFETHGVHLTRISADKAEIENLMDEFVQLAPPNTEVIVELYDPPITCNGSFFARTMYGTALVRRPMNQQR